MPGLAIELGKDAHLRAQHFGGDRHRNVVDRAHLESTQAIDLGKMNCRDENNRGFLEAGMFMDHIRQLIAINFGHADVHQHYRDIGLQQMLECLPAGTRLQKVFPQWSENRLVGQQLSRLIIDHQDVYRRVRVHGSMPTNRN